MSMLQSSKNMTSVKIVFEGGDFIEKSQEIN